MTIARASTSAVPSHTRLVRRLAARPTAVAVFDLETSDFPANVHDPARAAAAGHPVRFAPGSAPDWVIARLGPEPPEGHPHPTGRTMQIAVRRYEWDPRRGAGALAGELDCLLDDPDLLACCLAPGAEATHHIGLADLRGPGPNELLRNARRLTPTAAWTRFLELADGAVLMGQNILAFDIPMAQTELVRQRIGAVLDPGRSIDVLLLAREAWGLRSNTLRALATKFGVTTDPARDHDAMADIETCWGVWLAMQDGLLDFDRRFGEGVAPDQYRGRLGGLGSAWPVIEPGSERAAS